MKKSILKFALAFLLVTPVISNAQNDGKERSNIESETIIKTETLNESPIKKEKRLGTSDRNYWSVHLGMFDPWAGIYYERLVSPYWGFDAAVGLIGGSFGTKVYYPKLSNGKFSFYSGFSRGVLLLVGYKNYIPIGLTYLGKKGFRISFDIGPSIYDEDGTVNLPGLTLKLGYSY